MKTIYKYQLEITDRQVLQLPVNYFILDIQVQGYNPCMWVMVDTDAKYVDVPFYTYGTGHPIDNLNLIYLSTYQAGNLVFHVFEGEE